MTSKTQIPQGWRQVRLGDVAAHPRGAVSGPFGSSIASMYYVPEGVPVIRGNNLPREALGLRFVDSGFVFLTEAKAEELSASECCPDDLVFTARGTIGQVGLIPNNSRYPRYIASANQLRLRTDLTKAVPLFLYYWFRSAPMVKVMQASSTSTGVPNMNLGALRSLPILLPPLPEQRAIATVLDSIDDAIEGTEAVIAATEQLRDSLLHQLLTRGVPGWHTEWKEAPGLGTIPARWEVVRLGEVAEFITSGSRAWSRYFRPAGAFFVRSQNINDGRIDRSDAIFVQPPADGEADRTRVSAGDLLVSITGEPGKVTMASRALGEAFVSQHVALVRLRNLGLSNFTSQFLQSRSGREQLTRMAYGQTRPGLNLFNIGNTIVALPSLAERDAITSVLTGVNEATEWAREERDRLQLLKESTTDALLTGRVRVEV